MESQDAGNRDVDLLLPWPFSRLTSTSLTPRHCRCSIPALPVMDNLEKRLGSHCLPDPWEAELAWCPCCD